MRLRTDLYVSALMRSAQVAGATAYLRRRGAPEAGAVYVCVDQLDGRHILFGPAPQSAWEADGLRRFAPMHANDWTTPEVIEDRLAKEMKFDSDLWIVDIEDREGRNFCEPG